MSTTPSTPTPSTPTSTPPGLPGRRTARNDADASFCDSCGAALAH